MLKIAIVFASSRSRGDTFALVDFLRGQIDADFYDLNDYKISYYDYEYRNSDDDFLPLIRQLVDDYDIFLFASPVYWYAMCAQLKTFFDRLSDLIRIEKDTGRKLRGKRMAVLSCASEKRLVSGFVDPFVNSANYLGMEFLTNVHGYIANGEIPDEVKRDLLTFADSLRKYASTP